MPERRINIPLDKAKLVEELADRSQSVPIFRSKADVLAFAAALGASRGVRAPLSGTARDPIRHEVFEHQGYDSLINLLAVCTTEDPLVLADRDDMEEKRATIFEEHANGGLQILQEELRGIVDNTERLSRIVQLISTMREQPTDTGDEELDISKFIV